MSTTSRADVEAELRQKPSFEQAQPVYRDAVRQMADGVAALVPGMTWQFYEDSWSGCDPPYVHTGGVVVGRGGHVILAGRDVLRVRIVGSVEACATRISEQDGTSYAEAKRKVQESNKRRGKFIWDLFHSRYNDPTNFDLIVNTDYFRKLDNVVEIVLMAVQSRGLDLKTPAPPVAAPSAPPAAVAPHAGPAFAPASHIPSPISSWSSPACSR